MAHANESLLCQNLLSCQEVPGPALDGGGHAEGQCDGLDGVLPVLALLFEDETDYLAVRFKGIL